MGKTLHEMLIGEGFEFKETRDSRDAYLEFNYITIPKKVGENISHTLGAILPKTVALRAPGEERDYGEAYYVYWKKP